MSADRPAESSTERLRDRLEKLDPFLAPQLIAAGAIALDFGLPDRLSPIKPFWLLPSLEALVLIGLMSLSPRRLGRQSPFRRRLSIALIGAVSLFNSVSLVLLSHYLLHGGRAGGRELIFSGVLLWGTNVLLFSLWYWQLDRGGPMARATDQEQLPDFLFVQMSESRYAPKDWHPGMIDYLYTSFTNATAFSPTDTMPLTAAAKVLMSIQAMTALLTLGLVVARAVNILTG
jgi:hypothetical protein